MLYSFHLEKVMGHATEALTQMFYVCFVEKLNEFLQIQTVYEV